MATTVVRYQHEGQPAWGVVHERRIAPLSRRYASTADFINEGIDEAGRRLIVEPQLAGQIVHRGATGGPGQHERSVAGHVVEASSREGDPDGPGVGADDRPHDAGLARTVRGRSVTGHEAGDRVAEGLRRGWWRQRP